MPSLKRGSGSRNLARLSPYAAHALPRGEAEHYPDKLQQGVEMRYDIGIYYLCDMYFGASSIDTLSITMNGPIVGEVASLFHCLSFTPGGIKTTLQTGIWYHAEDVTMEYLVHS